MYSKKTTAVYFLCWSYPFVGVVIYLADPVDRLISWQPNQSTKAAELVNDRKHR